MPWGNAMRKTNLSGPGRKNDASELFVAPVIFVPLAMRASHRDEAHVSAPPAEVELLLCGLILGPTRVEGQKWETTPS